MSYTLYLNGTKVNRVYVVGEHDYTPQLQPPVIINNNNTITITDPSNNPNVTIKYLINGNVLNIDTNGITYTEPLVISGDTHTIVAKSYIGNISSEAGTYSNNYFYINNTGGTGTLEFTQTGYVSQTIETSTDRETWSTVSPNTQLTIPTGKTYIRIALNGTKDATNYTTLTPSFTHEYGGNILSLVYGENFILTGTSDAERTLPNYCLHKMFANDTKLTKISGVSITPNVIAGEYSFDNTFKGCTNIENGFSMRNIVGCGNNSFARCYDGCSKLQGVTAPNLNRIDSASFAYWLLDVYQTGTLYVSYGCVVLSGQSSGCPIGWTKIEI